MQERNFQRLFTLQEANALLPRLRPLADRLQEKSRRIRDELSRLQAETGLAPAARERLNLRAAAMSLDELAKYAQKALKKLELQ